MGTEIRPSSKWRIMSLGAGSILADGSEQVILYRDGGSPALVHGYLDLANMQAGDQITLTQYARVRPGGPWRAYGQEGYADAQALPLIYITKKPKDYGLRVTIRQTGGAYRNYDFEFFEES
jgi:hypothetical protein